MKVMKLDNLFFEELTNNRRYETAEREIEQSRSHQSRADRSRGDKKETEADAKVYPWQLRFQIYVEANTSHV